jgi:hypothetical protein
VCQVILIVVTFHNYLVFLNHEYFDKNKKWKNFTQKSRVISLKREKLFSLIFNDFQVKYYIVKGNLKVTLQEELDTAP